MRKSYWVASALFHALLLQYAHGENTKSADKCAGYYDEVERNTLGPTTFLAITSTGGKVLYTQVVDNSLAADGRALALVDSGLTTPKDIAYDPKTARIFVADFDAKMIVSYELFVHVDDKMRKSLKIRGDRVVVAEDLRTAWLDLDHDGNLYFTSGSVVNKIDNSLLKDLFAGVLTASDLKTQSEVAAFYAAQQSQAEASNAPPPVTQPVIVQLVSGLSAPTGIVTNGDQLYWGQANIANNTAEIVAAAATPTGPDHRKTKLAYTVQPRIEGVAMNHNSIFFAAGGKVLKVPQSNNMQQNGVPAVPIAENLGNPRGLAWDHDGTLYIADGGASTSGATGSMISGMVYAVPSGATAVAPTQEVVPVDGAYGVTVISCADEGIEVVRSETDPDGSKSRHKLFLYTSIAVASVLLLIGAVVLRY
ncbi:unnamed protein product [Amoebophrya sp. A120]|nr:unnamed protein product [Amoebophrya sp. A120]|eukprot:GSA120T00003350001.1